VDREEFDQSFKPALQSLVNRLTIYVASDDNVLLLGKLLYNVDSIGLPERFSPDTNLRFRPFCITRNSFQERLTWSMFLSPQKRTLLKSIVSFLRDLSWKICIG
jgi:hypothetical protein